MSFLPGVHIASFKKIRFKILKCPYSQFRCVHIDRVIILTCSCPYRQLLFSLAWAIMLVFVLKTILFKTNLVEITTNLIDLCVLYENLLGSIIKELARFPGGVDIKRGPNFWSRRLVCAKRGGGSKCS